MKETFSSRWSFEIAKKWNYQCNKVHTLIQHVTLCLSPKHLDTVNSRLAANINCEKGCFTLSDHGYEPMRFLESILFSKFIL